MSLRNKTIAEALREGKQRLRSAGKDAYAVEAELLLEKAVGLNRTAFIFAWRGAAFCGGCDAV